MTHQADGPTVQAALGQRVNKLFGFTPTFFDELVSAPAVANAYLSALEALTDGVLTNGERNVVMLAVSAANNSMHCVEVHRALAREVDVQARDVNLITMQQLPNDMRLQALVQTTWRLLDKRGQLSANDLQDLNAYGIERRQIYEVIATIGAKTIANYVQHIRDIGLRRGNGKTR